MLRSIQYPDQSPWLKPCLFQLSPEWQRFWSALQELLQMWQRKIPHLTTWKRLAYASLQILAWHRKCLCFVQCSLHCNLRNLTMRLSAFWQSLSVRQSHSDGPSRNLTHRLDSLDFLFVCISFPNVIRSTKLLGSSGSSPSTIQDFHRHVSRVHAKSFKTFSCIRCFFCFQRLIGSGYLFKLSGWAFTASCRLAALLLGRILVFIWSALIARKSHESLPRFQCTRANWQSTKELKCLQSIAKNKQESCTLKLKTLKSVMFPERFSCPGLGHCCWRYCHCLFVVAFAVVVFCGCCCCCCCFCSAKTFNPFASLFTNPARDVAWRSRPHRAKASCN